MLSNSPVIATIGVKDISKAKEFYENTLGLKPSSDQMPDDTGGTMYGSGNTMLFVYETQYGGTNQATSASWGVDDIEAEVADLESRGVSFETYDFPGGTREGAIHIMDKMKSAWFKDPDGNILNLNSIES